MSLTVLLHPSGEARILSSSTSCSSTRPGWEMKPLQHILGMSQSVLLIEPDLQETDHHIWIEKNFSVQYKRLNYVSPVVFWHVGSCLPWRSKGFSQSLIFFETSAYMTARKWSISPRHGLDSSSQSIVLSSICLSWSHPAAATQCCVHLSVSMCRLLRRWQVKCPSNLSMFYQVGNLGLLFMLLFFIYAALGVELFGELGKFSRTQS